MKLGIDTRVLCLALALVPLAGCERAVTIIIALAIFVLVSFCAAITGITVVVVQLVRAKPTSGRVAIGMIWAMSMGGLAGATTTLPDASFDPSSPDFLPGIFVFVLPAALCLITLAFSIAGLRSPAPPDA